MSALAGLDALTFGVPGDPPVVYLHGFPDHPPTARVFLTTVASNGFHVTAPWMPGYRRPRASSASISATALDPLTITDRVVALLDVLSPGRPVSLVGHDWGAVVTYLACARAPSRIARAVTLAVPHPRQLVRQLTTDPRQLLASRYMLRFQLPGAAGRVARDDFAYIDRLWRRWSPGFTLPAADRAELHAMLRASHPAPLAYYRSALRHAPSLLRDPQLRAPIRTPLLALHGADDGCILAPHDSYSRRERDTWFHGPHASEVLGGVGHWLHLEQPTLLAERVAQWLRG